MLTDRLPHGDGLVALGFIRELSARGHELHVPTAGLDVHEGLPPNAHLYRLGNSGDRLPASRLRFMWHVRRIYRSLAGRATFDLIHQVNPVDVGVSLALADERSPVVLGPYVPDWAPSGVGADAAMSPASLVLKRVLRAAQQRRATTALLSTPAAAAKLERRGAGGLRVHELSYGIDDRAWRPGGDNGDGQDVLFLANLEVRKGIHVLLDAFARLAPELPRARLCIAGAGPESDAVRRRIRESPDLDRVELLGRVERDRVMPIMRACDVYCLPSYGEPFGMAALEAMACGRPVVATEAGGLGHLVSDRGGRKVPAGDVAALAGALRDVLVDRRLRRSMGDHNRAVVEEHYAWPRVVDRLEEVYQEAIRNPRPPCSPLSRAR